MARGKRPPNPLMESDADLLSFLDVVEAYAGGAELESDCPMQQMTAVSYARLAEAAVHQHRADLPNGRVGEYTLRAQRLVENALAEECFSSGARWAAARMGVGSSALAAAAIAELDVHDEDVRRGAARHCAIILKEIASFIERKGLRGRPQAATATDKLALWDSMILRDAAAQVAPAEEGNLDAVSSQVPTVVRNYLRLGQLPWRGETFQDCVDIHCDRVRRRLESLPKTTKSFRGFSIKRRDT